MKVTDFLKEYSAFVLDSGLSQFSADQYKSYLKNACKKLPAITNHLELIAESNNASDQAIYAEQMNAAICSALSDATCSVTKKSLSNYKCAVTVLVAYIAGFDWVKGEGASQRVTLTRVSEYSKKDIKRVFLSRVKTQDRFSYSYGVFAARILQKIASRHKLKIFNNMVDEVKFLVGADKNRFILFKNIDKLIIDVDGHVYIDSKGKTYPLYTEVVKNGVSSGYEVTTVKTMRDLSLDHDTPLYYTLKDSLDSMPEYKKLSDSVKHHINSLKKIEASKFSTDYFKKIYPSLGIDENVLLKEMSEFLDGTKMTVMFTPYNSSKNKSI